MTSPGPALRVVGIGGTTRPGSLTERALRQALEHLETDGATVRLFSGSMLAKLPMYAPERYDRVSLARALVSELSIADAVVLASPGYHGGVSGLVKNALDYAEDLRDRDRPYLSGLPVGCIATGAGWQGVVATLMQLRAIVHALRGWPTPLGVTINTTKTRCGSDGRFADQQTALALEMLASELREFPRCHAGTVPAMALED